MISIYTSLYNLENGIIDWREALDNFCAFADEVCVATTSHSNDNTVSLLEEYKAVNSKIKLIVTDYTFDNYAFDGLLKNSALSICTQEFCMLLDGDERVKVSDRAKLERYCKIISKTSDYDALLIPVIDIYDNPKKAKSVGMKWYLHKNHKGLQRGIVNYAKLPNGKINHERSDTTELIYPNGNLVKSVTLIDISFGDADSLRQIQKMGCFVVYHLGWLDKQKRLKANAFWRPVWENRAGFQVKTIDSIAELDKIESFEHGLGYWNE